MAIVTLNTHGTSPDSWASNFPGQTISVTTNSVSINVNHPLYSGMVGNVGRWTEKDGIIGNEVNWETEAWTFYNLSAGYNYLRIYAVDADGDPEYNTGSDGSLGPYWVSAVAVLYTVPASCSFSNTPTVNADVTGDTGASTGQTTTIARLSTNWSSACSKTVAVSTSGSAAHNNLTWINGTDVSGVSRGTDYYFYASATNTSTMYTSAQTTIPFLDPKKTGITVANVIASADTGYWSATVSGVDTTKYTNYAVASSASAANSNTLITDGYDHNNNGLDTVSTGVNGSTITVNASTINASASNAVFSAGTTTVYLWCSRTNASGGAGGRGWGHVNDGKAWMPVVDGSGNTISFTITRGAEGAQNPTGSYYDTSTATGAKHSVTLTGLTSGKHYNVASAAGTAASASWAAGSSSTATLTINDTGQTVPSGTGATTTTYTIWSNSSASWTGATSTTSTYTRTLLNYDRYDLEGLSLGAGATSATYSIDNTISGHTYYIRKTSTTGSIVGQATASGTSTDITITLGSTDLGAVAGNTLTLYLTIKSPFNESPGSDYNSGKTITVTRTGSGSQSGGSATADYGLQVWNSQGELLYDTSSKIGRVAATGTTNGVAGQGTTSSVTVDGMDTSNDWNIIVRPVPHANMSQIQQALTAQFSVIKASGSFTIKNEQAASITDTTAYAYTVIRSG